MAYVVVFSGDHLLGRFELSDAVVVGRSPDCDIVIRDIQVSRQHCRIEESANGWVVRDLGSRNGTYVGGMEVGEFLLDDGDEVRIGGATIRFCTGAANVARPADPGQALRMPRGGSESTGLPAGNAARDTSNFPKPIPRPWGPGGAPTSDDASGSSTGYFGKVAANDRGEKKKD
jgi:pSer/pThr/pTyr-binding forkhead associated (FHA) protein